MNNIIHTIKHPWKILAFVFLTAGCTNYLGVSPDNRVAITNLTDFQALVTNAYPGAYQMFTEFMTDNYRYYDYPSVNDPLVVEWIKPLFIWSDKYEQNMNIGPEVAWNSYYKNIYTANVVLKGIDQAEGTDEELRKQIKGEALLVRAYCHFMLVNLFGKQYNASTAATDLGVPYTTEPQEENIVEYRRDNIQEVYDRIEKDALAGTDLLNDKKVQVPKYHFTKAAAYAFLCRFYQYKEDWDNCIRYGELSQTINSSVREFVKDYENLGFLKDPDPFAKQYCSVKQANILLMNKVLQYNTYLTCGFYANEFWKNGYEKNDRRHDIYSVYYNTTPIYQCRKFRNPNGNTDVSLFVTEEVMLNLAEAYVRQATPDYEKAIGLLNKIREKRFKPYTPLTLGSFPAEEAGLGKAVLDKIINERRVEFCYEGYRWFDCKRFQMEIEHTIESGTYTLAGDDLRYALQIPELELSYNPSMIPNPR